MEIGIESINAYCGVACLDVRKLFEARNLSIERFDNLLMEEKSVGLPCEDPVTNGVNAAWPVVAQMSERDRKRIELLIVGTESGLDFGKSMATYMLELLGLEKSCRVFEIKQACYAGTAALQMAAGFIASQVSPGAKALVVATDRASYAVKHTYAEPSQATGAVAFLVSDRPQVLELDMGAAGYYSYEVMDTCRPEPDLETGDPDLSLLSYLDCLEKSYRAYRQKVEDTDFYRTFDYFAFHTPFGGIVKGAHRKLMRRLGSASPDEIESDFERRVRPSLTYCTKVGNLYSASLYLSLCGLIQSANLVEFNRVGLFSYGSGCCSEFFSGITTPTAKRVLDQMDIATAIENRYSLTVEEYDNLLDLSEKCGFGVRDIQMGADEFRKIIDSARKNKPMIILKQIKNYHREYDWSN